MAREPQTPAQARVQRQRKRKTALFVFMFIALVLGMLVGYRYALGTKANIWYLFQVAKHTSMTLALIGESSTLEPSTGNLSPLQVRRALEKWDAGELDGEAASPPAAGALRALGQAGAAEAGDNPENAAALSEAALNAWERWRYRALRHIQAGRSMQEFGPSVHFVSRYGLNTTLQQARAGVTALNKVGKPSDAQMAALVKQERELEELMREQEALASNEGAARVMADRVFRFIVVPACGAIEVMAIFIAAVVSFPTRVSHRIVGLLVGIPVLYGVNVIRLSSLAVLGAYDTSVNRKWFNFFHEYVWQGVFIIFVVVAWLCWIEFVVQRKRQSA